MLGHSPLQMHSPLMIPVVDGYEENTNVNGAIHISKMLMVALVLQNDCRMNDLEVSVHCQSD